ncbi:SH3 domain-containing protein [Streptomyces sp. NPDC020965]|uniref:SH3 domain-containing protein n=1 Tax=Streptomyces sp. NPDC020965 TaxID=3365105 RepID=UPI0037924E29
MKPLKLKKTALVTSALLAATVLVPLATATPAQAHAPCGRSAPDLDHRAWERTVVNHANQRTGSSTRCASRGMAESNDVLDYHCFTRAEDGRTWTFVTNDSARDRRGWIRDDMLRDNGSDRNCGL